MALISCPECGQKVSDKAKACPNCGLPIQENLYEEHSTTVDIETQKNAKNEGNRSTINYYPPLRIQIKNEDEDIRSLKKVVVCLKLVSVLWIVIGIIQIIVGSLLLYYIEKYGTRLLGLSDDGSYLIGLISYFILGVFNIIFAIFHLIRALGYTKKCYLNFIYNERIHFRDIVGYLWNGYVSIVLFSTGDVAGIFLGILVLGAVLVDLIFIKIKVISNEDGFQKTIDSIRKNDVRFYPRDTVVDGPNGKVNVTVKFKCEKCDGENYTYPCKYCGYMKW